MSFIDQLMAARLFGGNNRYTTPPINPSPNVNTIPDGGYRANLLPTGGVRPQVNMGLMGQVRQPPPQPWETYDVNKPGDILPQSYWEAVKQTVSEIGKKPPQQKRNWDKELEDSLIEHEGYETEPYWDKVGKKWTIGIGHTAAAGGLDPKAFVGHTQTQRRKTPISDAQVMQTFEKDLKNKKKQTEKILNTFKPKDENGNVIPNSITGIKGLHPAAKNILTEMVFQMGPKVGNWNKMLTALQNKNYKEASKHMLFNFDKKGNKTKTKWHTQTSRRANRLAERMRNI